MSAADAKLVAAVGKKVESRNLRSEDRGIMIRQHMHQRANLIRLVRSEHFAKNANGLARRQILGKRSAR